MSKCQNSDCGSKRIANVSAKCSDACMVRIGGKERDDYVPGDMGIGGGDYIDFEYCLECGQIQDNFPMEKSELELGDLEEEEEDDSDDDA